VKQTGNYSKQLFPEPVLKVEFWAIIVFADYCPVVLRRSLDSMCSE
jgi:hypothetical protein